MGIISSKYTILFVVLLLLLYANICYGAPNPDVLPPSVEVSIQSLPATISLPMVPIPSSTITLSYTPVTDDKVILVSQSIGNIIISTIKKPGEPLDTGISYHSSMEKPFGIASGSFKLPPYSSYLEVGISIYYKFAWH